MSKPNPGKRHQQHRQRPIIDNNPTGPGGSNIGNSRVKQFFVDRARRSLDTPIRTSLLGIAATTVGGLIVGSLAGLLVVLSADWPKPWPVVFIWGVPALLSVVRQHLVVKYAAPQITDIAANIVADEVGVPNASRLSRYKKTVTDNTVRSISSQSTAITVVIVCCGSGTYLIANAEDVHPAWLVDTTWGTISFVSALGGVASLIEALKVPDTIKALWRIPWRE